MKGLGVAIRLWVMVMAIALIGTACSKDEGTAAVSPTTSQQKELSGNVSLFAYEDSFLPDVIGPFREAHPNLTLQTAVFNSQDEAVTKLEGGFQADVIFACLTDTQRMVSAGLVQPIDTSRLTAWDSLFPYFRDSQQIRVNDKVYVVPNIGGATGLLYNPEQVPAGVTSYRQLLEDPALKGLVTIEDNPKYGIAMGALALGYSDPYDLSTADLDRIKSWFIDHKSQIRTFYSGDTNFLNLYRSGEIVAAFGYKGYDVALDKEGVPVVYRQAAEGSLTWTCGYAIGAHAQNLDAVYGLLNYYMSPQVQAIYATTYNEMVTNQDTLEVLPASLTKDIGLENPAQLDAALPTQLPANYDQWLEVWREIKTA